MRSGSLIHERCLVLETLADVRCCTLERRLSLRYETQLCQCSLAEESPFAIIILFCHFVILLVLTGPSLFFLDK